MNPKPVPKDKQRCCVLNCSSRRSVRSHRFPFDKATGLLWVQSSGNVNFRNLKYEEIYGSRYVICHCHFKPSDYQCGVRRRLKEGVIPSLMLPEKVEINVSAGQCGDEKIDIEDDENSTASINVVPPAQNFSSITFNNYPEMTNFPSSESVTLTSIRSKSMPSSCIRNEILSENCAEKSENLIEMDIRKEEEKNLQKNSVPENVQAVESETKEGEGTTAKLQFRTNKRTVCKKTNSDEETSKMHENVLEAKKKRNNYKRKSKRPRRGRKVQIKINLDCGFTETMRDCLKEMSDRMVDPQEKVCTLIWDEVALQLHLKYCAEKDKVVGLEDWGINRTFKYADRALVFMLRGVKSGWNVPLTYNFCAGQTTHGQLICCIKEVVREVTNAGFVVACTVCDQGSLNMRAIQSMQEDTNRTREEEGIEKYGTILIDDVEIIPLYNPPHLLKCIRNNFLTKDIEIDFDRSNVNKEDRKYASWQHIITAYEIDVYSSFLDRHLPNLTEQHIYLDKIPKMKVKMMMQVFSSTCLRFIDLIARSQGTFKTSIGNKKMPKDGIHTALVLQLMNGIADGFNGVSFGDDHPKRTPWRANSYHNDFFTNARRQLKSMRFVDCETRKPVKTDIPCLSNLIDTLQGFKLLWKKLQSLGFKSFDSRNINQDPLENFFETIKSNDFQSNKPTCSQFETIFKSLLISILTSKNFLGFKCDSDTRQFILSDCNALLKCSEALWNEDDNETCLQEKEEEL